MIRKTVIILSLVLMLFPVSFIQAAEQYRINPGDVLEIHVWKDDGMSGKILVPPDGIIAYPLIGSLQAAGLTVRDLEEKFSRGLKKYLPDTPVTVSLAASQSLTAYVIGKVNNPGQFPIKLDTNIMQILAMAGGLNPYADSKNILVLRKQDGRDTKLIFNYNEVEKGKNLEQNIVLKRGDVVVVP